MKLSELLKNIKPTAIVGDCETEITGVEIDSRKVEMTPVRLRRVVCSWR